MSMQLSTRTLACISAEIPTPVYDRSKLKPGIVHFGIGNFHRAHQAVYIDTLFNQGHKLNWGIIGAGVRESDHVIRDVLVRQDFLTTVVAQEANASEARIIGPLMNFIAPGDIRSIINALSNPNVRIVSMTVTEGGYFINPANDQFDPLLPEIVADANNPQHPQTVFGLITAALQTRCDAGIAPFTVMSCDNVLHNGDVARNTVIGLAQLWNSQLAEWISKNVMFPNSMVDRITPTIGDRERRFVEENYGYQDDCPVFCEGFKQWVLEDRFSEGRPALEEVGVQIVSDVTPFEIMKLRILNGSHAVMAYPSALLGIEFKFEAMANPLISAFMSKVVREEIIPVIPQVPNVNLVAYFERVVQRYANPQIRDTNKRICENGSNKQPKFIIPTIRKGLAAGNQISGLATASALWCRYCYGETERGDTIDANDPNWNHLVKTAQAAKLNPHAWLEMTAIYGDLGQSTLFSKLFSSTLISLWTEGVEATLNHYLERRG